MSDVGVIFRGSSWILAILCQCQIAIISTLNFGPWSTKLGGTILILLWVLGLRQRSVYSPRRYLRFGTFGSIFSGHSAVRRAVFRPPGRILARKSVFCYRIPDFVNGPFVTLCETVDLAPSDRFFVSELLPFSFACRLEKCIRVKGTLHFSRLQKIKSRELEALQLLASY